MGKAISISGFLTTLFLFGLGWAAPVFAQTPAADSTQLLDNQRRRLPTESFVDSLLRNQPPSLRVEKEADLAADSVPKKTFRLRFNDDAIDAAVEYSAEDSMYFDVKNSEVLLWGRATMKYKSIDLKADYIRLDYANNTVTAMQRWDSTGRFFGMKPDFSDGDQQFTANKLKYNFKSQKGLVFDAHTKQDELYVVAGKTKFLSNGGDSTKNSTIYNADAILTTCDAEHPHYGIHASKLKVVPDKVIVVGPSYLELGGIPTPIVLPFGFFPVTKTKKAGLLLPRDFDYSPTLGLGFQNIGWYQPIGPRMDATVWLEWYLRGTWGLRTELRYLKKYKFNGNTELGYRNVKTENARGEIVSAPGFKFTWSHQQAQSAHPTRKFGGSVNIQTNDFNRRNRNDYASVFNNQLSSNLNYTQSFPGRPFQLNASFTHSQNTQDRSMRVTLPNLQFQMTRIYPFQKKERVGKEKWFEKTSLQVGSQLRNEFVARDDSLFTPGYIQKVWENKRFGLETRANSDVQIPILKYLNFTPTISYTEATYFDQVEKTFDPLPILKPREVKTRDPITGEEIIKFANDTTRFGTVNERRINGYTGYREFTTGAGLSTTIFGTKLFKKGWLRGIRHKMSPTVGFSFVPYLGGAYIDSVQTSTKPNLLRKQQYSILEDALFLKPSLSGKTRASISFSLANTLEAKYWSRRDSVAKKVSILRSLSFSGSYDLTADSLNWSQINTGANFPLFKGLSNLQIGVGLDPYISEKGRRVNKFASRERGKILTMPKLTAGINTNMTVRQLRAVFSGKKSKTEPTELTQPAGQPVAAPKAGDDFLGLFDNFSLSHTINMERRLLDGGRDTFLVSINSLDTRGSIPLTSKWSLQVSHIGWDFIRKELSYPDLGFSRDMHCWEMAFNWQPVRGTYNFYLSVKPGSVLEFLKVKRLNNNVDGFGGF